MSSFGVDCTCELQACYWCSSNKHHLCPEKSCAQYRRFWRKPRVEPKGSDKRFHELLKELGDLHDKKAKDYGSDEDPLANVRASEEWGMAPWVGAMVRLNDKVRRLQTFAKKGSLANESAADSLKDIAVYSLIALILLEETSNH